MRGTGCLIATLSRAIDSSKIEQNTGLVKNVPKNKVHLRQHLVNLGAPVAASIAVFNKRQRSCLKHKAPLIVAQLSFLF